MRHARWPLTFARLGVLTGGEALVAQGGTATYAGVVFSDFSGEPVVSVAIGAADVQMGAQPCLCYAQVYLDKAMVYYNRGNGEPLFNLNSLNVDQVAIEYYAGPSETPLEYSTLNSNCGVLVIHTRRTRR